MAVEVAEAEDEVCVRLLEVWDEVGSTGAFEGSSGVDETEDGELRAHGEDDVEAAELVLEEPPELVVTVDNETPVSKYDVVLDVDPEVTTVETVEVQKELLTEAANVLVGDELDTLEVGEAVG